MYNQNLLTLKERTLLDSASILTEYEKMPKGVLDVAIYDNQCIDMSLMKNDLYKVLKHNQGEKDFYIPTHGEIEDLAVEGYFPNERGLRKLIGFFIHRLGVNIELAEYTGARIQRRICGSYKMQDIFDVMEENHVEISNDKEMEEIVSIINELWNDTRMIVNRGFKPDELCKEAYKYQKAPINANKKKQKDTKIVDFSKARKNKIYPNDPCPCGSGKKYKHCCGKANQ